MLWPSLCLNPRLYDPDGDHKVSSQKLSSMELLSSSDETRTQSPAACLPYDILQEIFKCCLPDNPLMTPQLNKTRPPLILCHVCTSWRIAAFSDHRLWKHLHVCLRFTFKTYSRTAIIVPQTQVDMIAWWTTRIPNGDYTYSFNFTHQFTYVLKPEIPYADYREVFRIPAVKLARSVTLAMSLNQWGVVCEDRTLFSQLKSLKLSLKDRHVTSRLGVSHLPLLRRLETSNPEYPFPWGQLTHLNLLHGLGSTAWRNFLGKCTNLHSAMFRVLFRDTFTPRSVTHPNLRQLVIQSHSLDPLDLLEGILLPTLRSLRLLSPAQRISPKTLSTILQSTPSLRELHLYNCINFLKAPFVSLRDSLNVSVPRLEHLVIEIELTEEWSIQFIENLAAFVRSRWVCSNWASSLASERSPYPLHVEIILRKNLSLGFNMCMPAWHLSRALTDFDDPNVRLTITDQQEAYWDPPSSYWDPPSVLGSNPGAIDDWETLVKFRIPDDD